MNGGKNKVFFSPDTNLIKNIDSEINAQYCESNERYNESHWNKYMITTKADSDNVSKKAASKHVAESLSSAYCKKLEKKIIYIIINNISGIQQLGVKELFILS